GGAVIQAVAADRAVGEPPWRLRVRTVLYRPRGARRGGESGSQIAQGARAAMGCLRRRGASCKLRQSIWLERDPGLAEDLEPRRRAAADHGMAAGGFRQ